MKPVIFLLCLGALHITESTSIYDFKPKDIHGLEVDFNRFKGKVLLIVNVASECGFTDSHYKDLQRISVRYLKIRKIIDFLYSDLLLIIITTYKNH